MVTIKLLLKMAHHFYSYFIGWGESRGPSGINGWRTITFPQRRATNIVNSELRSTALPLSHTQHTPPPPRASVSKSHSIKAWDAKPKIPVPGPDTAALDQETYEWTSVLPHTYPTYYHEKRVKWRYLLSTAREHTAPNFRGWNSKHSHESGIQDGWVAITQYPFVRLQSRREPGLWSRKDSTEGEFTSELPGRCVQTSKEPRPRSLMWLSEGKRSPFPCFSLTSPHLVQVVLFSNLHIMFIIQ